MNPAHPVESAEPVRGDSAAPVGMDQQVAELLGQWRTEDSGSQPLEEVPPKAAPGMMSAGERSGSGIAGLLRYLSFNRESSST